MPYNQLRDDLILYRILSVSANVFRYMVATKLGLRITPLYRIINVCGACIFDGLGRSESCVEKDL